PPLFRSFFPREQNIAGTGSLPDGFPPPPETRGWALFVRFDHRFCVIFPRFFSCFSPILGLPRIYGVSRFGTRGDRHGKNGYHQGIEPDPRGVGKRPPGQSHLLFTNALSSSPDGRSGKAPGVKPVF